MKLILHIGTEKTGTTLIQKWLYANSTSLSKHGIFLSDKIGQPNNRDLVTYFRKAPDNDWLLKGIKSQKEKEIYFDGFLDAFSDEIEVAKRSHHTCVVTSEFFHSRLIENEDIAELFRFLESRFSEISVLCYLRPQWDVRKSLYSTGVKSDVIEVFSDFQKDLDDRSEYYNYLSLYRRWKNNFPTAGMEFRVYDRNAFPDQDIRKDVMSVVHPGFDLGALDFNVESANESVRLLLAHAMIAVNRALPRFGESGFFGLNLLYKSILNKTPELDQGEISDNHSLTMSHRFCASNEKLFRSLGMEYEFRAPAVNKEREERLNIQDVAKVVEETVFRLVEGTSNRLITIEDSKLLTEIARKCESGGELGKDDAIALLKIAEKSHPQKKNRSSKK
ncbi:hypothetical protein [Poseidonocella sp. HB161398]|uniref:hypothetical protein n=1 Tax=Poseidonocella sp. HB161398 TaxID=2320855 RepID=UPI001109ECDA|nr:hypothetical protein [Poseidonocella sp. HB161398]